MGSNHIAVDNDFFHIRTRWDFVHHIEKDILNDTAQSSRPGALFQGPFSSRVKGIIGKDQLDAVKL